MSSFLTERPFKLRIDTTLCCGSLFHRPIVDLSSSISGVFTPDAVSIGVGWGGVGCGRGRVRRWLAGWVAGGYTFSVDAVIICCAAPLPTAIEAKQSQLFFRQKSHFER